MTIIVYGSLDDNVGAVVGSGFGASDGAAVGTAVVGRVLGDSGVFIELGAVGSVVLDVPVGLSVGPGVGSAVDSGAVGVVPGEPPPNQRAEVNEGLPT